MQQQIAAIAVPPVFDFYFTPSRASALGARTVKTILEHYGFETELFNFPALRKRGSRQPLPDELSHLKPHIIENETGPLSFFTKYQRFGPDYHECAEMIKSCGADYLFISCFAWAYAESTLKLAEAVKNISPEVRIIAGGAGVTVNPVYFADCPDIDQVLCGEAEKVLGDFLKHEAGISGSLYESELQPFIPSAAVNEGRGKQGTTRVTLSVSRGCPNRCSFCSNFLVHGREFRKLPIPAVEDMLKSLRLKGPLHFNFEDDNLLADKSYFIALLELLGTRYPGSIFTAENGLEYNLLSPQLTRQLIGLGFRSFNLSMASSDLILLDSQNRPSTPGRLKEISGVLQVRNILSTVYFICGMKNETIDSTASNLIALHNMPVLTGISMFYPVPGLPGFENPEIFSKYKPFLCAGSSAWPWNNSLSTAGLITAFRLARLSNMIKTLTAQIPGTRHDKIQEQDSRLVKEIFRERRLKTIRGKEITDIPEAENKLVETFLEQALRPGLLD